MIITETHRNQVARAFEWTPGGSQTGSKAPGKAGPLGDYPALLRDGMGATVHDADGNEYIDFIAGLAAVTLGHADWRVTDRVVQALKRGSILSLPTPEEADVAEKLCLALGRRFAQQVRFVKTGSEATEAAVRIARCATGRDKVLTVKAGYHAWHSWFQAVKPQHPGVPAALESLVVGIEYGGDFSALDSKEFAAVILEGMPLDGAGDRDWLVSLFARARANGTVAILDEIVWGFRLKLGGVSEFWDVEPDLACYGKALGNGVPIACVVGPRDLMKHATVVSGTFGGDRLGLAAATGVLDTYAESGIIDRLWEIGSKLEIGLRAVVKACPSLSLGLSGVSVRPILTCGLDDGNVAMSLLLQEFASKGILWHPSGANVMAAMSDGAIEVAIGRIVEAAVTVDAIVEKSEYWRALRGVPFAQAFARAR